jgi:hypothetical protein
MVLVPQCAIGGQLHEIFAVTFIGGFPVDNGWRIAQGDRVERAAEPVTFRDEGCFCPIDAQSAALGPIAERLECSCCGTALFTGADKLERLPVDPGVNRLMSR